MINSVQEPVTILSKTPSLLRELLIGLDSEWIEYRKHDKAFTPLEVVKHLILGEETDWIPRMKIMLAENGNKRFTPFDRTGFNKKTGLHESLESFEALRKKNLEILLASISVDDLKKTGIHPELGEVTLDQLLATWVVHDITHIFQIIESLALRYKNAVGPWIEYLRILNLK